MGIVSDYWSANSRPNQWYSFCGSEINRRVTGDPELAPGVWALRKYCKPFPIEHLMEIGCLTGDKLAGFVKKGIASRATGIDVAAGAIATGQEKWHGTLDLLTVDLNAPDLPKETYSVIQSNGVLHHIQNLEACVQALYDSLKPGGVLLASEFTGPCRFAYSDKEVHHIRQGQEMLPEALRGKPFNVSHLVSKLNADPSEAIRTRDIGPVLKATFDHVIEKPYGGNVLMRALTPSFFENFSPTDLQHISALQRLIAFDAQISEQAPSHHAYFVARKGPVPQERNYLFDLLSRTRSKLFRN